VHVFTDLRKVASLYSYIDTEVLQLFTVVRQSVHATVSMAWVDCGTTVCRCHQGSLLLHSRDHDRLLHSCTRAVEHGK
jgi:hypothetical protein